MGPETWGPHGWKFIHFITMAYPDYPSRYDKQNYKNFFINLSHVIPCSLCGDNYKDHLRQYPLTDDVLSSQTNLMEWGIKMHNLVNEENRKKVFSNEEAYKLISKEDVTDRSNCKRIIEENKVNNYSENNYNNSSFIFCLCIIVGIIIFIQYYNLNNFNDLNKLYSIAK
jgi:hypothetical protein